MTGFTYGIYLVYNTSIPTTADTFEATYTAEGTDWIKLSNKGTISQNVTCQPGVMDLPGGSAYAINLGTFSEKFTIQDICTRTQYDLVLKFLKRNSQPAYSPFLYLVICTSDTGPALMDFYQDSVTPADYCPVVIENLSASWQEGESRGQHWSVNLQLTAVWE